MPAPHLKKIVPLVLLLLGLWLGGKYLMPIVLPFLLAALLALAAEPLVGFLHRRTHLPRVAATGIGVTMTLGILFLLVSILGALLLRQLQALADVIPDLEGTALTGLDALQHWLMEAAQNAPDPLRPIASRSVAELFKGSSDLVGRISAWLLGLASRLVSNLPDSAFGIGTWLLASYMISVKLPKLRQNLGKKLPEKWVRSAKRLFHQLKYALSGWFTAQMKLIGITFGVLATGFFLLRFSHWGVWAVIICLLDALPVLGSGMALIPWSIVCFLQGDTIRAVGLLGIFTAVVMVRSILEPKLVGKQLGLDPLVTLFAMYGGYRLWGLGGLVLSPLLTVTAVQLLRTSTKEQGEN